MNTILSMAFIIKYKENHYNLIGNADGQVKPCPYMVMNPRQTIVLQIFIS
jgi:hypothetical protein